MAGPESKRSQLLDNSHFANGHHRKREGGGGVGRGRGGGGGGERVLVLASLCLAVTVISFAAVPKTRVPSEGGSGGLLLALQITAPLRGGRNPHNLPAGILLPYAQHQYQRRRCEMHALVLRGAGSGSGVDDDEDAGCGEEKEEKAEEEMACRERRRRPRRAYRDRRSALHPTHTACDKGAWDKAKHLSPGIAVNGTRPGDVQKRGVAAGPDAGQKASQEGGRCQREGCWVRPGFGPLGGYAMRCSEHRQEGDQDLVNARCAVTGCGRGAIFGTPSREGRLRWCTEHRGDGQVNLRARRCCFEGCFTQPCYGMRGLAAERCAEHRLQGQINVVSKRCQHDGCDSHPSFGDPMKWTPIACSRHKHPSHTLVVGCRCSAFNCTARARFKPLGQAGKPLRCTNHKVASDVDTVTARCKYAGGCQRQALFGREGGKRTFCGTHRTIDCINLAIRRRLCTQRECKKRATHGIFGSPPNFCGEHAPVEPMDPSLRGRQAMNLRNNTVVRRCKHPEGCHHIPTWAPTLKDSAILCYLHRHSDFIHHRTGTPRGSRPSMALAGVKATGEENEGLAAQGRGFDMGASPSKDFVPWDNDQVLHQRELFEMQQY